MTNISPSFTYKMAAKINWYRYGTIITSLSPYVLRFVLMKIWYSAVGMSVYHVTRSVLISVWPYFVDALWNLECQPLFYCPRFLFSYTRCRNWNLDIEWISFSSSMSTAYPRAVNTGSAYRPTDPKRVGYTPHYCCCQRSLLGQTVWVRWPYDTTQLEEKYFVVGTGVKYCNRHVCVSLSWLIAAIFDCLAGLAMQRISVRQVCCSTDTDNQNKLQCLCTAGQCSNNSPLGQWHAVALGAGHMPLHCDRTFPPGHQPPRTPATPRKLSSPASALWLWPGGKYPHICCTGCGQADTNRLHC